MWKLVQTALFLYLIRAVRDVRRQGARIMADQQTNAAAVSDELDTLRLSIDTYTNQVADEIRDLVGRIPADGGLDAKQTASLKAWLQTHEQRMRQLAADGANPVPAGTPDVPTPTVPAPAPDGTDAGGSDAPPAGDVPADAPTE